MKKCIFPVIILSIALLIGCGKTDKNEANSSGDSNDRIAARYINAKSGLRMRRKPGLSAEKIRLLPMGEKVTLLEETGEAITIGGTKGKWARVKWKNISGWVFGGFLLTSEEFKKITEAKK